MFVMIAKVFRLVSWDKLIMNSIINNIPDILTVKDICSLLQIGRNTAYDLIHSGAIRHIRIKNQIRIPKSYVIEYIQQSQKEEVL